MWDWVSGSELAQDELYEQRMGDQRTRHDPVIAAPSGLTRLEKCGQLDSMNDQQAKNPLHGITLEQIVTSLVEHYGWDELGWRINIRCFNSDPSIKSSLKFLRKTPWAREKVENLYLAMLRKTRP